jgi:gag-polypeptide of LTR copia-type
MDLKMQLHSLQKGHMSMQSYLDQKHSLADQLRLMGSSVSDEDLQLYILHGLNIDFDPLIVSLTSRSNAVSFNELSSLLLTHEQRLQKYALTIAGASSTSLLPAALQSTISETLPHANLASSSHQDPLNLHNSDILTQFTAFLSSKGSWHGKVPDK